MKPIFEGLPQQETCKVFHQVNHLLKNRSSRADAALNWRIAQLLGYLIESREARKPLSRRELRMTIPNFDRRSNE